MPNRRLIRLLAALGAAAVATPSLADVFPDSSRRVIGTGELANLTCDDLWYARNEIFYRNGYIFDSERGRAVFGTGGFTKNPSLNGVEQENVAIIKGWEQRAGCR